MIGCIYVVKSVNRDGSISRAPETKVTRRYRFATVEQAQEHLAKLEVLNPGRRFAVVAVDAQVGR